MIFPTSEEWNSWKIADDAHRFFLLRWEEIFNEETFDSWQIRSSNVRTILSEILTAADIVEKVHVYHHNIGSLLEELRSAVEYDTIIKRYYGFVARSVTELRSAYEQHIRNSQKLDTSALKRPVRVLLGRLSGYCETLFSEIHKILAAPPPKYKIDIDTLIMLLGVELKSLKYSTTELRNSITILQDPTIPSFADRFLKIKSLFSGNLKDYECDFILSWSGQFPDLPSCGVSRHAPTEKSLSAEQAAFRAQDKEPLVVTVKVQAMDAYAARSIGESLLETAFSAKKMYQASKTAGIKHPHVLVRSSESEQLIGPDLFRLSHLKDSKQPHNDISELMRLRDNLDVSDFGYLNAALQYHKLSIIAGTDEVRLVNLWIALESLVQDSGKNVIDRITTRIPPLLTTIYPYSLLRALSEDMRFFWRNADKDDLLSQLKRSNKYLISPNDLLAILLDVDNGELITKFSNLISVNPLLLFRVHRLRDNVFKDPQIMLRRLEEHKQNLVWHLKRIYRLRNNIIHQGKSFPETRQLFQHAHAYFLRTIHTVMHDLKSYDAWGISDVFEHRTMMLAYFESRLRQYSNAPFARDFILDLETGNNRSSADVPWQVQKPQKEK